MKVIAIGYDKKMFDRTSSEFLRMQQCAAAVDTFDLIIFTRSSEPYVTMPVSGTFTVHATASRFRVLALLKAVRLGRRIARERGGIDVVTSQDPFETGLVGWFIARFVRAKLNIQLHTDVFNSKDWLRESLLNPVRRIVARHLLKAADSIRVVSLRSKRSVLELIGNNEVCVHVLPVAVELPLHSPVRSPLHQSPFVFVTAARLSKEKNLPLLLRAFKTVHSQYPNTELHIIGAGQEEDALRKQSYQLFGGVDSPVSFFGWTNNLHAELTKADVYVLSSNYEGWGRVLIEALAAGLPIVTTDVGCVGEVIKHDEHGLVVPVGDEAAFASALITMVSDSARYKQFKDTIAALDLHLLPGANLKDYGTAWRESLC